MTKPNNRHSTVVITVIIILAVAIATILIFRNIIYSNNQQAGSDDGTSATSAVDDSATEAPVVDEASVEPDSVVTAEDTPLQYEGVDPNDSQSIEATLTYYGLQNAEYLININIPQYLNGTCQITLGSYTGTVSIDQSAASSACSFHIPVSKLTAGLQPLKVNIQSSAATGVIEETIDVSL